MIILLDGLGSVTRWQLDLASWACGYLGIRAQWGLHELWRHIIASCSVVTSFASLVLCWTIISWVPFPNVYPVSSYCGAIFLLDHVGSSILLDFSRFPLVGAFVPDRHWNRRKKWWWVVWCDSPHAPFVHVIVLLDGPCMVLSWSAIVCRERRLVAICHLNMISAGWSSQTTWVAFVSISWALSWASSSVV